MALDPLTDLPTSNTQEANGTISYGTPTAIPISSLSNTPAPLAIPPAVTVPMETFTTPVSAIPKELQQLNDAQAEDDKATKEVGNAYNDYSNVMSLLGGVEAERTALYQSGGTNTAAAKKRSLAAQASSLQSEAEAIPISNRLLYKGSAGTDQQVQNVNYDQLAQNALKALSIRQQYAIADADYATAKELADQQVDVKNAALQARLATTKARYEYLSTVPLSRSQQKLLDAKNALLKKEERDFQQKIDKEKKAEAEKMETRKTIDEISMKLRSFGVDDSIIKNVSGATSVSDAIIKAGNNLRDPKARAELENYRIENLYKEAQIRKMDREARLLGEPTPVERKEIEKQVKEAKASIPVAMDKIEAVDALASHEGLNTRVGTSFLSRGTIGAGLTGAAVGAGVGSVVPGIGTLIGGATGLIAGSTAGLTDKLTGSGQDFSGGVHKLVSGLSLDALIEAKSRGATFGALSDSELRMLAAAASKINDWEIKDDKGIGTGVWNIDEKSFKTELKSIQDLTRRALQLSQGTVFTSDESELIDGVYDSQVETESASPEQFFSAPVSVNIPKSSRLSYVNNNPGNLRYAGQSGASQGEGGFARFSSPEDGLEALKRQVKLDASRGHTLATFVNKYAPPTENDTNLYISQVAKATGANPNTPISDIDITKLVAAIARKESGTNFS